MPITPAEVFRPEGTENPMVRILLLLSATVGIPYLLVSSTAPLLQHWFIGLRPGASPYRFCALSNAGSLLGL